MNQHDVVEAAAASCCSDMFSFETRLLQFVGLEMFYSDVLPKLYKRKDEDRRWFNARSSIRNQTMGRPTL